MIARSDTTDAGRRGRIGHASVSRRRPLDKLDERTVRVGEEHSPGARLLDADDRFLQHPSTRRIDTGKRLIDVLDLNRQVGEANLVHRSRCRLANVSGRHILKQLDADTVAFEEHGSKFDLLEPQQPGGRLALDLQLVDRGKNPATLPLAEVMTPDPDVLPVRSTVAYALNKMCVGGFRHVPVVDEEHRPAFVVSVRDVVEFLVEAFPREVLNLSMEITISQRSREGA